MDREAYRLFGLIGRNIGYSFSRNYFTGKFEALGLRNCEYVNFDLADLSAFQEIARQRGLSGLNVTIPYKEAVLSYLDFVSPVAAQIGAVNTIEITADGLTGHNTDWIGFRDALLPLLRPHHKKALILGTGGASRAVAYALAHLSLEYLTVSRSGSGGTMDYDSVSLAVLEECQVVINCTPVGTFPDVGLYPPLPYSGFTDRHLAFDLVYNPEETEFMKRAQHGGAAVSNGYLMLRNQAEKAWEIWNGPHL